MCKEYDRRDFLKLGGTIGAGLVSGGTLLSGLPKGINENKKEKNKTLKAKEKFGFNDNVMIIDNHAHIWPHTGDLLEQNFKSVDEHMKYMQKMFIAKHQSARRVRDDYSVKDAWKTLFNDNFPEAHRDVNFRYEEGRYIWEADGEKYYYSANTSALPEMMISLMDEVGVDKAVLQHTAYTYKLNKYCSRAVDKYPERFIALAWVDSSKAYTQEGIEELQMAIENLGLKGLWFDGRLYSKPPPQGWYGYVDFHTSKYDSFWRAVRSLDIPVYFQCSVDDYPILEIKKWIERFTDIPRVLIHGFPQNIILKDGKKIEIRDICVDIVENHNVYIELLPLCHRNYQEGPKTDQIIRCLYETFGPSKLLWGSELGWTQTASEYSKILSYIEEKCDYMSKDDLKLILEGNLRKIFRI